MLLRAMTFIGGRDGVFCVVTGSLGVHVEALEHRIQELVSELKLATYLLLAQPTGGKITMNTSIIYILEIYLITRKGRTRMRYLQLHGSKSRIVTIALTATEHGRDENGNTCRNQYKINNDTQMICKQLHAKSQNTHDA